MADITLQAQTRTELGRKTQTIRNIDLVPGVIYGGKNNLNIKFKKGDIDRVFRAAGESAIIEMTIDEKTKIPVLIHDYQLHPVTTEFDHVDFYEVDMNKEIKAMIPLHFIGESPAVKELGGSVVKNLNEIEIRCLPADLVQNIEVSLTVLKTYADSIHVKDLPVPAKIKVVTNPDLLVAKAVEQKVEVEAAPINEAEAVQAVASAVVN
jgi:large subunit ribosomal protein L25